MPKGKKTEAKISLPVIPDIDRLINTQTVPAGIWHAYYSLTNRNRPQDIANRHYFSLRSPFIYLPDNGIYVLYDNWEDLQNNLKGNFPLSVKDMVPQAMRDYVNGFYNGYTGFINDVLGSYSAQQPNDTKRVYDYVRIRPPYSGEFTFDALEGHVLSEWDASGITAGRFYHAWHIILRDYNYYKGYFTPLKTDLKPTSETILKKGNRIAEMAYNEACRIMDMTIKEYHSDLADFGQDEGPQAIYDKHYKAIRDRIEANKHDKYLWDHYQQGCRDQDFSVFNGKCYDVFADLRDIEPAVTLNDAWNKIAPSLAWRLALEKLRAEKPKDEPAAQHISEEKTESPQVDAIALAHAFWVKYDSKGAITKTNVKSKATTFGRSENTILARYTFYQDAGNRKPASTENKKSVNQYLRHLDWAINYLKKVCPSALNEAEEHRKGIADKYT